MDPGLELGGGSAIFEESLVAPFLFSLMRLAGEMASGQSIRDNAESVALIKFCPVLDVVFSGGS